MNLKLPDGTTTDDIEVFGLKWNEIIEPLEQKFDIVVSSFDPGFTVYDKLENSNFGSVHIPMWLAKRMVS